MEKSKVRDRKRPENISTGIFDLFIYETIAAMAEKHKKLPADKQNIEMFFKEIEEYGFQIGSRAVDWVSMIKEEP